MSAAPREWRCPSCGHKSTSSRAVRARYCGRCSQWCVRVDDPLGDAPWFGEPEMGMEPIALKRGPEVLFEDPGVYHGFGGARGQA